MALKFILSICVLMCLIGQVASSRRSERLLKRCMQTVRRFPYEAKGFAEVDATKKDLEVAIESIIAKTLLYSRGKTTKQDLKARFTSRLTRCFEIRKVK